MDGLGAPIPCSTENVQRLRALIHPTAELRRAGYVLEQLTPQEIEAKKRCERCNRLVKKRDVNTKSGTWTSSSASETPSGRRTFHSHASAAAAAAAQAHRVDRAFDDLFNDLSITEAPTPPPKPKEPIIRCRYHPGNQRGRLWTCCDGYFASKPCAGDELHRPIEYPVGQLENNWKMFATPPSAGYSRSLVAVVIDCEMGTAKSGDTELIRISCIDFFSREVILDSLVWPTVPMAHYNTRYSGVTRQMMTNARQRRACLIGRQGAREAVWQLVGPRTVVIGHAGQGDLLALRWIHPCVVDTLMIEKRKRADELSQEGVSEKLKDLGNPSSMSGRSRTAGQKRDEKEPNPVQVADPAQERAIPKQDGVPNQEGGMSLKALTLERLDRTIQVKGRGHDSVEDATATRDLLQWHMLQEAEK